MGYLFGVHAWLVGLDQSEVGKAIDAETSLQKQMCFGEWLGAVGWTLLSHHGRGLAFLPFHQDIFSYSLTVP